MKTASTLCVAISCLLAGTVHAETVKVGVLLGFTGPIESLAPGMAQSAELAIQEVSASGNFLDGRTAQAVRGDSTCLDAAAASSAAERLITAEKVSAIVGADCSGVTTAVLQNVALPNGVVMVSPASTTPALSSMKDDDLFFRTAPSDARQGFVLAQIMKDRGIQTAALTYTNNDYGKGIADSIQSNFEALGGEITVVVAHEDGRADYSAELGTLGAAGGDVLVVAGYLDQGGKGIIQSALDLGAFDRFVLPDGMIGDPLPLAIGPDLDGAFGTAPGVPGEGVEIFQGLADAEGIDTDIFSAESYDAAALILLAMQAANSSVAADFKGKIIEVANAPGEKILPGELSKGLQILADGGQIDYVGASGVELIAPGESQGNYREVEVKGGAITTVRFH